MAASSDMPLCGIPSPHRHFFNVSSYRSVFAAGSLSIRIFRSVQISFAFVPTFWASEGLPMAQPHKSMPALTHVLCFIYHFST